MRKQLAFTLFELIVTMALAAIVMTIAIPSFTHLYNQNSVISEVNRFVAHIQYARAEAIKRQQQISICRGKNGQCGNVDNKTYDDGWLIYVCNGCYLRQADAADERDFDASEGDLLLKAAGPSPSTITIRSNTLGNSWLNFGADGNLEEPDINFNDPNDHDKVGEYAFCYKGESTQQVQGRLLKISFVGRPEVTKIAPGGDCTP